MAKKIRWTNELFMKADISKLDKVELARAFNFAASRANIEIRKLKDFERDTGYRAPALDFIENPGNTVNSAKGKGIFYLENPYKASQKELRRELSRLKHFMGMESSSMPKVRKLISKQKDTVVKTAKSLGMKITKKSISLDDLSDFYKLFRMSLEYFDSYGSDQLKEAVWAVYREYGNMNFSDLMDVIREKYKNIYEEEQEKREKRFETLLEAQEKLRKEGRKKNSSKDWEEL